MAARRRGRRGGRNRQRRDETKQAADQLLPKAKRPADRPQKRQTLDPEKHYLPERPDRDLDPCVLSGLPIDSPFTAIADPATGRPSRFEHVFEMLRQRVTVGPDERFAYLGRGAFGVVKVERVNGRPTLVVRDRIQYEDSHGKEEWRQKLAPGISRDYRPAPEPIYELYTPDEIATFPRFSANR